MGLGLVVSIGGMCWSWGWSVGTGEGATSGLGRTLGEAVVIFAAAGLESLRCVVDFMGSRRWWRRMVICMSWCHVVVDGTK